MQGFLFEDYRLRKQIIFQDFRCRLNTALHLNFCSDSEEMFVGTKYLNKAIIKFHPDKTITASSLVIL